MNFIRIFFLFRVTKPSKETAFIDTRKFKYWPLSPSWQEIY